MNLGKPFHSDDNCVEDVTLFVALLCVCVVIGRFLKKNPWMNESITSQLLGLFSGAVILLISRGKSSRILVFDEELFFIYLLPPIIFNAGFRVKKKKFFQNIITIALLGVFGTLISVAVISLGAQLSFMTLDIGLELKDYLALGAIFAATDSVCTLQVLKQDEAPLLYSLVFGEGVINDATSIVLFNAIRKFDLSHTTTSNIALDLGGHFFYLFLASTFLGVVIALLSAYVIRKLCIERDTTDREVALVMAMPYLSYLLAELFGLSGILTVFVCGIVMSHYTWHNTSDRSKVTTKYSFATLSYVAEIFIFLYVGMDALDIKKWKFVRHSLGTSVAVSLILLLLVMVGRAAFIFPICFFSNLTKKHESDKIGFKQQIIIWWAGLMRGAVSMALAYNKFTRAGDIPQQRVNAIMITSTISVVLFTTMVFGVLTKPLIRLLLTPPNNIMSSSEATSPNSHTVPLLGSGEAGMNSHADSHTNAIQRYWRSLDNTFMRPIFGGRGFAPYRLPIREWDLVSR